MGKLLLCSGKRTKRPYLFKSTKTRVYSIEELCYHIYQSIYFISDDIYSDALTYFIQYELGLPDRAAKIRHLKEINADAKSIVTVILCSCDYFSENEIKKLLKIMDDMKRLTPIELICIRANYYIKSGHYMEAAKEFEQVMEIENIDTTISPKEYGDILHNLAVTKIHLSENLEAMEMFREAYERNQNIQSLKQYLYSVKLNKLDKQYKLAEEKYQADNLSIQIEEEMKQFDKEAEECDEMKKLYQIIEYKNKRRNEYIEMIDDFISSLKREYRRGM